MHLLILGHSSIVRRRVLPAARTVPAIRRISVASRGPSVRDVRDVRDGRDLRDGLAWFDDYDEALASSGADVVYVSGPNASHRAWAMRALERGLHIIVDKPAFLDLEAARAAVSLAGRRGRGLAEATVFAYHPQIAVLQSLAPRAEAAGTRAVATFCIPPLPAGDFRYRRDDGGGSLYDQGPYVAAINRLLFGAAPATVHSAVLSRSAEVDTAFSFLLAHDHGGTLVGHCGFVTAYQNRLSIVTPARALQIDRVFSTPADRPGEVRVAEQTGERSIAVPAADAFACFLEAFTGAIERGDVHAFEAALLEDAALVERLRSAVVPGGS